MIGHTSSVLSVDAHSSGLVASGSEDGFLKIWRDGFCIQSIEVLDCIWNVKFLENGDIATASGDGAVRIWTSDKDRIAEAIELEFFEISLAERKKLGLDKLEDIKAFNSPDQDDEVLAPPPTPPTVAPPPPTVAPPTTTVAPPTTVAATPTVAPTVMVGGEENRFQRSTIVNCSIFLSTVAVAFIASMLLVNFKEKSEISKKLGLWFCAFAECGHQFLGVDRGGLVMINSRYERALLAPPPVPSPGGSDLFPGPGAGVFPSRGPGVGGSMLIGPNDPRWFPAGEIPGPDFPGGNLIPPGARFDPIGPPDVPGFGPGRFVRDPRRGPGRGGGVHPDLQRFQDPDYI